jgi:hypothetical protein
LLRKGDTSRQSLAPGHSDRWIRSHLVVLVKIHRTKMSTGHTTTGSLYFVDLAGSERMKLIDATGAQLREAQSINKFAPLPLSFASLSVSLSASLLSRSLGVLSDVIQGLAAKQRHIPYRNSKLTFLLQDALKENSKILMFVNITPSPVHTGDSVASLQFGAKCRSAQDSSLSASDAHLSLCLSLSAVSVLDLSTWAMPRESSLTTPRTDRGAATQ